MHYIIAHIVAGAVRAPYCGGSSGRAGGGGGGWPGAHWITVPDGGGRRGVVGPALLRLRALW